MQTRNLGLLRRHHPMRQDDCPIRARGGAPRGGARPRSWHGLIAAGALAILLPGWLATPGEGALRDEGPPASRTGGDRLALNGGVDLSRGRLAEILRGTRGVVDEDNFDPCRDTADDCEDRPGPPRLTGGLSDGGLFQGPSPSGPLPQTPPPTTSWKAHSSVGGFPSDSQLAVSSTHVIVSGRMAIRFYNKAGTELAALSGGDLFAPLGLDDGSETAINRYNDLRMIFDEYRKRFWIVAMAGNNKIKDLDPEDQRMIIACAISKTENPLDGWWLYWWDGAAGWGNPSSPVWEPGDTVDYPVIGIDPWGIHQNVKVANTVSGNNRYWHLCLFPGNPMAAGQPGNTISGWHYWDMTNPNGDPAGLVQPAVHHGNTSKIYYAGRQDSDKLVVWRLSNPLTPSQKLERVAVTMPQAWNAPPNAPQLGSTKKIKMTNLGTNAIKAVFRWPFLYAATNDSNNWGGGATQFTSPRFVRLFAASFPNIQTTVASGFASRRFGGANVFDDPPGAEMWYGWPAVEVNKNFDAAIVYARTGATIYPQVRYSVYLDDETDIRPSRLLKAGEAAYNIPGDTYSADDAVLPWGDTAGACVDPKDNVGIWMAQQYARTGAGNNGNYQVWVGKVFGKLYVDWEVVKAFVSVIQAAPGARVDVSGEIANGGDGRAGAAKAVVTLTRGRQRPTMLAQFEIPELGAGATFPYLVPVTLPTRLRPGDYLVEVRVGPATPRPRVEEYSRTNNSMTVPLTVVG